MPAAALGIDVGLSGVRAAVVAADGRLLGTARRRHPATPRRPGVAEHDPRDWLDGVRAAAHGAVRAAGAEVGVVGIAALGPAPVLVDANLEPLAPAPLFSLDRRADAERTRLAADGGAAVADHALPHLRRLLGERPELRERAAWALDATGFLVARCVGTPVMDAVTRGDHVWPGEAPAARLPAPLDPRALAGELDDRGAELLGLPAGVPVTAGTYDSFVDVAAAGVAAPGDAGMVLGSTLIVGAAAAEAEARDGLAVSAYPGAGVFAGGWSLTGGAVLDWAEATLQGGPALAAAAAGLPPGAGGVRALPFLAGERTPVCDLDARGAALGLSLHTTPAELYRALVDALALVARDHAVRLPGGPPARWRATGGGVRNPAWAQATADALGAPLDVVAHAGEAVGPALLALAAVGAPAARAVERTLEPDAGAAARFDALFDSYRSLQQHLAAIPTPEDLL